MKINETARIYNLFPRLLGSIPNWVKHFPRISEMKFNWIFLNPIQYTGFSGSLYSIKDYYKLNPMFYDSDDGKSEMEQIKWMIEQAHRLGLKVMLDLVINHTAIDHPFTKTKREWYKLEGNKIANPGAWDGGKWIKWGDLAEIDNESSSDRENLWKYWLDLVLYYLDIGIDGFRCDAAYKVPADLWIFLIKNSKERFSKVTWFAESLGCPIDQTINLGQAGFEYTFNSSKWWDYKGEWCLSQYNQNIPYSKTISFPESHDTIRLYKEYNKNPKAIEHKYLFSSLFSSGVMIPIGFEYGFTKRINVVSSSPKDYETVQHDFSEFIKKVNILKSSYRIFNEESMIEKISVKHKNIVILLKTSSDKQEQCLLIINKDFSNSQTIILGDRMSSSRAGQDVRERGDEHLPFFSFKGQIENISIENNEENIKPNDKLTLKPGEIKLFYAPVHL